MKRPRSYSYLQLKHKERAENVRLQLRESAKVTKRLDDNEIDLAFRWLAARRDYPYALAHEYPSYIHPTIFERCLREFARSNPGFVL